MPGANIGKRIVRRIRYVASIHSKDFREPKSEVGWAFFPPNTRKKAKVLPWAFFIRVFCKDREEFAVNRTQRLKKSCSHRPACLAVVCGGGWPVRLGFVFHSKKNGPQGRGYNPRAGFPCSHRPVAGPPPLRLSQQEERPTGPWLQLA